MKKHQRTHRKTTLLRIGEIVPLPETIGETVEISILQLAYIDLSSIPEGLHVWVKGSETPLISIERRENTILATMSVYGKPTNGFLLYCALAIAAKILENEGYPVFEAEYGETGRMARAEWKIEVPANRTPRVLMNAVRKTEQAIRTKANAIMPAET
jgi:hypothetical protein